jgi:protocatechuate 3,4-dioxygenase beta subunit
MSHYARRRFLQQSLAAALVVSGVGKAQAKKGDSTSNLCTLTAEQEEGPFYIEHEALRSNLLEDRSGVPLVLRMQLFDARLCVPLQNASMEIWSCDAMGEYSGYDGMAFGDGPPDGAPPGSKDGMMGGPGAGPHFGPPNGPPDRPRNGPQDGPQDGTHFGPPPGPPPHMAPSNDKTFLRGMQLANKQGKLEFTTLYPGCYEGRVNHVHVRVRLHGKDREDGRIVYTGQIFFPENITDAVLKLPPYSTHKIRRTLASEDPIFTDHHGQESIARLVPIKPGSLEKGFTATVHFGIDPEATPAA